MSEKKKKVKEKLTRAQQLNLDDLISCSKDWGIQQEYGTGSYVDTSEKNFNSSVADMTAMLLRQNAQMRKLKSELQQLKSGMKLRENFPRI